MMTIFTRRFLFCVALGSATSALQATSVSFNDQGLWASALGGGGITVFHFDGPTETHGKLANDPTINPSYSSQGVDFLPFANSSVFPQLLRGQDFQITTPGRDGLLSNINSPNQGEAGRAILLNFNITVLSVGAFSNNIDRGTLEAFDASNNLIGTALIGHDGAGQFGGIVTDTPIAHVRLTNTFNADLTWGIYDLQFSSNGLVTPRVPDSGSTIGLLVITTGFLVVLRRRSR
jgi:hypothetical protein